MEKVLAKITNILEDFLVVPYLFLVVASAAYSRYLIHFSWSRDILTAKNILLVGLVLVLVWFLLGVISQKINIHKSDFWWLLVPIVLAFFSLITLFWYPFAGAKIYLVEFWLYGLFITLFLGLVMRTKKNFNWVVVALLLGLTGVIGIGLYEKIFHTHLALSNLNNPYREQWAVTSVFINQNNLAASLSLILPIIFGLSFRLGITLRIWSWLLTISGLVLLFFTGSYLAMGAVALAALVFLYIALVFSNSKKPMAHPIFWGVVFIAVLAGLATVAWLVFPFSVKNQITKTAFGLRDSFDTRVQLMINATDTILTHPLKGLGAGSAESALAGYHNTRVINAHNLTMELAINFGLPFVLLWAAWLISLIVALVKLFRWQTGNSRWLLVGLAAGLVGFFIAQAAPSTFVSIRAPFILIGFSLAAVRLDGLKYESKGLQYPAKSV